MNFKLLRLSAVIIALLFAIVSVQGQTIHQVSAGDNTLDNAIAAAVSGDIIELTDSGGLYTHSTASQMVIDKTLTIRAQDGLAVKPIIRNIDLSTTSARIFEIRAGGNLMLQGLDIDCSADNSGAPHAKNAIRSRDVSTAADSFHFELRVEDCILHNSQEALVKAHTYTIGDTITFNNTIFDEARNEAILFRESTSGGGPTIIYTEINNCTFTRIGREALYIEFSDPTILINHCTFDSISWRENKRVLYPRNVTEFHIKNSIITNQLGTQSTAISMYGNSTISYTDTLNIGSFSLNGSSSVGLGMMGVDPQYTDPANDDYTLQPTSPVLGQADDGWAMGDLRWDPTYIPVTIHRVEAGDGTLSAALSAVNDGDIIELVTSGGIYSTSTESAMRVENDITIRAQDGLAQRPILRNINTGTSTPIVLEIKNGGSLKLYGVELDGFGADGTTLNTNYQIRARESSAADSFHYNIYVEDCYFHDSDQNFFKTYQTANADTIVFKNCIFDGAPREALMMGESSSTNPKIGYIEIENCTFTNIEREAMLVQQNPQTVIRINHCTFDSVGLGGSDRVLYPRDVLDVEIKNSIFSNQGAHADVVRLYGTSTISYCDTFNVGNVNLEGSASIGAGMLGVDPLYTDPANYDYRLATASLVRGAADDGRAMGDLRWEADPGYFYLDVFTNGSGTVTLDPTGGLYAPSTTVTLTANPAPGWAFDFWDNPSIFPPNVNPATITMNQDETVTANFVNLTPQVTLTIDTLGLGTITVFPEPNDGTYDVGTVVTLTATPDPNWHFVEWLGDFTSLTNPVDVQLDSNMAITGSFLSDFTQFTLTDSVQGLGSISLNPEPILGTYDTSTVVYVTANPALGWEFTAWGGDLSGNLNPDSVTLDSDKLVIATFSEQILPTRTLEIDTTWDLRDAVEFANNNSNIDSILLTTIGLYTSTNPSDVAVMAPLTIAAAPGLSQKPVVTNSDSEGSNDDIFRVFDDFILNGVVLDGGITHGPKYGIRLRHYTADSVKTGSNITITNCDFRDFFDGNSPTADGHAFKIDTWIKAGDVTFENCTFTNTGYEAIRISDTEKWPTDGAVASLTVRNCTFTNIDAEGIRYYSDTDSATVDAPVLIEHVTFNNSATRTMYLKNSGGAIVRDIIIANSRISGHGRDADLMDAQGNESIMSYISHIDTFNVLAVPIKGTDAIVDESTVWGIDPKFEDPVNLNYTLLPESHLYGMGHDTEALGDLNWATNTPTHKYLTITVIDSGHVDQDPMPVGYTYDPGTVVTLTAVPDTGWEFVEWGGDMSGNTNPDTITMNTDKSITATFQLINSIDGLPEIPTKYELSQNYPNPFNPSTTIKFALKEPGPTTLKIFDILGREVATIVDKEMKAGYYSIVYRNVNLATGVYFYQIHSKKFSAIKKMLLVK